MTSGNQGDLGYYYSELVIPFAVSYPWDLTYFMNSTLTGGRDGVSFTVGVSQASGQNFVVPYGAVVLQLDARRRSSPDEPLTLHCERLLLQSDRAHRRL